MKSQYLGSKNIKISVFKHKIPYRRKSRIYGRAKITSFSKVRKISRDEKVAQVVSPDKIIQTHNSSKQLVSLLVSLKLQLLALLLLLGRIFRRAKVRNFCLVFSSSNYRPDTSTVKFEKWLLLSSSFPLFFLLSFYQEPGFFDQFHYQNPFHFILLSQMKIMPPDQFES